MQVSTRIVLTNLSLWVISRTLSHAMVNMEGHIIKEKDRMYAERGPRVTHVNTLSIITLQNIGPDVTNEIRKQSRIVFIYM